MKSVAALPMAPSAARDAAMHHMLRPRTASVAHDRVAKVGKPDWRQRRAAGKRPLICGPGTAVEERGGDRAGIEDGLLN